MAVVLSMLLSVVILSRQREGEGERVRSRKCEGGGGEGKGGWREEGSVRVYGEEKSVSSERRRKTNEAEEKNMKKTSLFENIQSISQQTQTDIITKCPHCMCM